MINKCMLAKDTVGGGYSPDSIKQLQSFISDLFYEAIDSSEDSSKLLKFNIKKALLKIRETYNMSQVNPIVAQIEEITKWDDFEGLDQFFPEQGVLNTLKYGISNESEISQENYQESETTITELNNTKTQFLDSQFGNQTKLKNELKQKVTHKLLNTFIINREEGRLVTNTVDANNNAREYKQQLFNTVTNYLKKNYPKTYSLSNTNLYEGDKYTNILSSNEFKPLVKFLEDVSPTELKSLSEKDYERYEALTAWFTLKNFDNFVNLLLGDVIGTQITHRNKFTDGDGYFYNKKGSSVITSWRTTDNQIMEEEISSLVQSLLNSVPFYKKGIYNETGKYIKFEDFYRMITRMKDLVLKKESDEKLYYLTHRYLFEDLSLNERKLIEGKSLKEIINKIQDNSQLYTRLALRILIQGDTMKNLGYSQEEIDKTYSIYRGLFDPKNEKSIFAIQNKYDHTVPNYYSLITQAADSLYPVKFLQYNNEDGVVTVRSLRDQGSDNVRRELEFTINNQNSRSIIGLSFETTEVQKYNVSPIINQDTKEFEGITFTIKREGDLITDTNYDLTISVFANKPLEIRDAQGTLLDQSELNQLWRDFDIREFIDNQLKLELTRDKDLADSIGIIYDKSDPSSDLLTLSSTVFLNKYISNVVLKNISGRSNTVSKLESIFTNKSNKPSYNSTLGEMSLIPDSLIPILERIASAKSITTGVAQSAQVRNAEGDMLSSQTTSRLLGSYQSQWQRIKENPNNPAAHFSLFNIVRDVYTAREYKSIYGNKDHTQFTVSESFIANFLYDYVGGFLQFTDVSGKKIIGNGTVGILPSVNSDKNTMGRVATDLNEEFNGKPFLQLDSSEILGIIGQELGLYYSKMYQNIKSDWQKLQDYVNSQGINVDINPDTNFRELNEYADSLGLKTVDVLYDWTLRYNRDNAVPITLIEQTHFVRSGREIITNNTLRALLNRYNNPERLSKFFDYKRTELLKSLMDENVELNLYGENTDKQTAKQWLLSKYPDWVNKSEEARNGKMVIAKMTFLGNTYNITTKQDFIEFNEMVSKFLSTKVDFLQTPHKLLNPKYKVSMELHPMLDKYNLTSYFVSQEFMLSGVGSHTNHPGKAKFKTPIIWGHPALGKTTALSVYSDKIMDWDEEFNIRRDKWIEQATGTKKGTPEFKNARNEYLIHWRDHPEFKKFVEQQWDRIKQLANSQNKILFASPAMLLELFPDDFNRIITMDKEEFVKRGLARGDSDPTNWKQTIDAVLNPLLSNNIVLKSTAIWVGNNKYLTDLLEDGSLYNELGQLTENEMQEEAARFLAQHKRNVSYTAAMYPYQLGQTNGIPTTYNMACIADIEVPVYTISGDRGDHKPFDGATYGNPFIVNLENNSLNGDRAGIDKKPFVHFYNNETGTGGIIKTAVFGLTNDRIRRYQFYRDMMHNMTNYTWKNEDGTDHIVAEGGILKDFNENNVDYGTFYFKSNGKYYLREINKYLGNNTYEVTDVEVDQNGTIIGEENTHNLEDINSNYQVWRMFGGHNSMEMKGDKLLPSEKSIELTTRAIINYGIKKSGDDKVQTAENVYQPMKHSDIHWLVTSGAIKQGVGNLNPKSCFYGHHQLNFMPVKMFQSGIQLDKEHHADDAEISTMTQVMSAACNAGYNKEVAERLYNAVYSLSKSGTRAFRNKAGNIITGDQKKFDQAVTDIIVKQLLNANSRDGDLVQAIASDLIREIKKSKDFTFNKEFYDKASQLIPISDPAIYPKIVNMITVALTKAGIKAKMSGILAVLNPSHEIIKFYKLPDGRRVTLEKLEDEYGENIEEVLENFQKDEPMLEDLADVEMGYKYYIEDLNGNKEVVHINRIHGETIQEGTRTYEGEEIPYYKISYEEFRKRKGIIVKEWVKEGQDLKSYNVRFTANGVKYQIADLDIVQDYFSLKDKKGDSQLQYGLSLLDVYSRRTEFIDRIEKELQRSADSKPYINVLKSGQDIISYCNSTGDFGQQFKQYLQRKTIAFMNRQLQIALNGISPSSNSVSVKIKGNWVNVDKSSIKISHFGLVMPKTFKTNLGLEEFDDLQTIKNDPDFFLKRIIDKFGTKVEIYEDDEGNLINNYHLELKRTNGKHIYIRTGLNGSDLVLNDNIITHTDELGNVFRIDPETNTIMYQLFSKDDKIYKDLEGNEIIVTSPDIIKFTDADGNELDATKIKPVRSFGDIWIDEKTGNQIYQVVSSGMQFYLDNLDYNSFSISRACSDAEFLGLMEKAKKSHKTSKLANAIEKRGSLKEQRKFVNKMNNYQSLLSDDTAMSHLKELGNNMYTSFLKSLHIIAARIPAQSQQSFMSMEVEAYDNPDINSAYVSLFQFYLQGSDLDIDAVSLQTFDLGRDGIYTGHSPYYTLLNTQTMQESEQLPFPTGEESSNVPVSSLQDSVFDALFRYDLIGLQNKFGQQKLFNLDFRKDGTVKIHLDLETPGNITKLASFIQYINDNNFKGLDSDSLYTQISRQLVKKFGTDIGEPTINMIKSVETQIKEIVDKHNMYIERSGQRKRDSIIKNYITQQLFTIISDPINRRQADSSVDVVTGPAKDLAKLSPKATVQNNFTPGNTVNMFQSISENMVGKDGIAICATGLKSFFALTELYQLVLNDPNIAAKESLLFNVSIGGKEYRGLANGYSKQFKSLYEETVDFESQEQLFGSVADYLLDQLWASDAANEMSALLGLSTDNAKELVLAKINAGISTIGMYLYGLSIGVPFNELYRIMTSPLAFRLAELTKGNMFNGDPGTINIVGALRYLNQEPSQQLSRFNNLPYYEGVKKPLQVLQEAIQNELDPKKEKELNSLQQLIKSKKDKKSVKEFLNKIRSNINQEILAITEQKDKDNYQITYNQLIDFAIQYTDDVFLTINDVQKVSVYGNYNLYRDIEMLATGAEEMKQSGKILKLNQKIETNPTDLFNQVNNIEEVIIRRLSQYKNQISRLGSDVSALPTEVQQMLSNRDSSKYIEEGGYRVNLEKLMTNEEYARQVIQLYNNIKQSYNLPQLITKVPNYRGYVESLLIAYKAIKDGSVKTKAILNRGYSFIQDQHVVNPKLKEQVIKNAERATDLYLRQTWMQKKIKPIKISAKKDRVYAFIDNAKVARELTFDTEYKLGTTLGDANFKLWMETVMIPKLKEQLYSNKFIRDLKPVVNTRTNLGSVAVNFGLTGMMPRSEYERDAFNEYKEEFNKLAQAEPYKSGKQIIPIQDLFYYYSLIANDGRVSSTSIQAIFEDYLQNDIPKSYRQHIHKIDSSPKEYDKLSEFITPEMLIPSSSPYVGGTDIMKYTDRDTNNIVVYKKIKKKGEMDDYGEYEDYGYYDEEEIYDPKAEINGYKREFKTEYHNWDNRNYFYNPMVVEGLVGVYEATKEQLKDYETLSRFKISVFKNGDTISLVDLISNDPKDAPIIDRFKKEVKKDGLLTMNIERDGKMTQIVDLSSINNQLKAIENGCI